MGDGFTVSFKGDHVRIDSNAERSFDYATALWTEVAKTCQENNCFAVLAVSNAPGPMPVVDGYDHAELFRGLGIGHNYRIAFAELNDEARPATEFVETVLKNRGLPGNVFANEEMRGNGSFRKLRIAVLK